MAFTLPESDLDSSLDHLISSPREGTSRYSSFPETNQGLYPAWLPLLQIPDIFSNQDISLSTLTLPHPTPPPLPPPPPPRYGRFLNRWFTFQNIWLFKQVFRRALTKKRWLTLTLTLPTHHHQGMVGFLTGGSNFPSEKGSDKNIWLWIPAILTRVGAWVQVKTGTSPH